MKDGALFMCRDLDLDELGSLTCRRLHKEQSYFAGTSYSDEITNLYIVDVEGKSHRLIYYTVGSSLYCWNSYSDVARLLSSTMLDGHVSYAAVKPVLSDYTYVYITDGVSMLCDNGIESKTWGIDKPDGVPLVEMAGSGGNLGAGDYSWVYTFYDGETGSESDPSIASVSTTAAANDEATVTQIGISSNDRVNVRRVYRTLVGGGTYYLVAPINDNVATEFVDNVADASLTAELNMDQGVSELGDVIVSFKQRVFLSGDVNFPNRVYYSRTDRPDNFPSTNYLEVGTSDDEVRNIIEFEGKLYFMQSATISGLYGSDESTFAYHQTRSHVGLSARWTAAAGPDGIYFLSHDGVYRFDGLKSMKVSEPIDRSFGVTASDWCEIVDQDTVEDVARGVFMQGKYYLVLPMRDGAGTVTRRLLSYDVFDQSWLSYSVEADSLLGDAGDGVLYGGLPRADGTGYYSVYELMTENRGFSTANPLAVTKSFPIVGKEEGKSRAVGWLRKFRVDCIGGWVVKFYVDGSLVLSKTVTGQGESTRYQWYDFPPKTKGRYLTVMLQVYLASGTPTGNVFKELEVV